MKVLHVIETLLVNMKDWLMLRSFRSSFIH
ncbi:hypothetical protein MUGA111182_07355 [Mucilaginibacter galii]